MTVHMFRVYVGVGPMSVSELETRIDDWVSSNPEWEADNVSHTLQERATGVDASGETYHSADVRFRETETKSNLLQKLTDKLKDKVAWYRVGYHVCHSDGDPHDICATDGWDDWDAWTAGDASIPSGVPSFP